MNAQELKQRHGEYNAIRLQGWDADKFRSMYIEEELILHILLECEVFYLRNSETESLALMFARDAYPETTIEDLMQVYSKYADTVTEIYG